MGLGDDRVPRGQRRGEIRPGRGVVGEREVVGAEDRDRPAQGAVFGAEARLGVDRRPAPGAVARRLRGLAELEDRAREFHGAEARIFGQPGLAMGGRGELGGPRFDREGIGLEEFGDGRGAGPDHLLNDGGGRGQGLFDVGCVREGIEAFDFVAGRGIRRPEKSGGIPGRPPSAADQDVMGFFVRHGGSLSRGLLHPPE